MGSKEWLDTVKRTPIITASRKLGGRVTRIVWVEAGLSLVLDW